MINRDMLLFLVNCFGTTSGFALSVVLHRCSTATATGAVLWVREEVGGVGVVWDRRGVQSVVGTGRGHWSWLGLDPAGAIFSFYRTYHIM